MHRVCCHRKQASKKKCASSWETLGELLFAVFWFTSVPPPPSYKLAQWKCSSSPMHSVCTLCRSAVRAELSEPWAATDSKASAFSPSPPANVMELMFAEWEDGERFSFEDSDRFEEDSLCSFISEAESLCQNWRGWRKQSAGPNSPTVKIKGNRVHPGVLNGLCMNSHCHCNAIPVTPLCPCAYLWP